MARCSAIKSNGERCKGAAMGPHDSCWSHDPENAAKRSSMASKAARAKPSKEIAGVKVQLQEMVDMVLSGELDRSDAAVCGQLLNVKLRALEVERKIRETQELEERIERLELTRSTGDARWAG